MSARSTTTCSLMQMYCCLTREPQVLCNRLNEISLPACVAGYTFTGIDTRPKESDRSAIERAAMCFSCLRDFCRRNVLRASELIQTLDRECLFPAHVRCSAACQGNRPMRLAGSS